MLVPRSAQGLMGELHLSSERDTRVDCDDASYGHFFPLVSGSVFSAPSGGYFLRAYHSDKGETHSCFNVT
jgi:hypothetical protein